MLKKIATTALAVSALAMATQASAMTGVYVNGNLGYAKQSYTTDLTGNDDTASDSTFAWEGFLGYNHDMNDQWGLGAELGYADYNEMKWTSGVDSNDTLTNEQYGWIINAVGTYHADDQFDLFAKAGLIFGKNKLKETDSTHSATESETNSNTQFMTTLGVGYNVMPELAVVLQWEHIFGNKIKDEVDGGDNFQTVNAFMAGVKYTFEM